MSGLEEVGVPGPDHLREALTNCTDPLAAIEEFQARTTVKLESIIIRSYRRSDESKQEIDTFRSPRTVILKDDGTPGQMRGQLER